jgi:hypothetical protein
MYHRARQSVDSGTPFQWTCCERFFLTAGTVWRSRDWEHSPAWQSSRKSVAAQGHEIVWGHSWKGGMNTSIFQLAPWAGPAYLALADAIERAIQAGSVQAGDRLPPPV